MNVITLVCTLQPNRSHPNYPGYVLLSIPDQDTSHSTIAFTSAPNHTVKIACLLG